MAVSSIKLEVQAHTKSFMGTPASMRAMVAALMQTALLAVGKEGEEEEQVEEEQEEEVDVMVEE